MGSFVVKNNVESLVVNDPLAQAATTLNITPSSGSSFPSTFPFLITLWDDSTYPDPGDDSGMEIVKCTGRTTDALTIVRGQESTSDVAHALGERVAMLVTAGIFNDATYGVATKLDGVEDNATADQTNAEIRTAYETVGVSKLAIPSPTELTLDVAGAITVTKSFHTLDTFGDAATDNLDTINGGTDGMIIVLRPINLARDVVVRNGAGNIVCGGNITLTDVDTMTLIYLGSDSVWLQLGYPHTGEQAFLDADHTKLDGIDAGADVTGDNKAKGVGTSAPSSPTNGDMYSAGGYLYVYYGGSWCSIVLNCE